METSDEPGTRNRDIMGGIKHSNAQYFSKFSEHYTLSSSDLFFTEKKHHPEYHKNCVFKLFLQKLTFLQFS